MRLSVNIGLKHWIAAGSVLLVLLISLVAGAEYYTSQPEFCGGTCHTMKKPYTSWKESKHNEIACVDCHFAPGEKFTLKAKFTGLAQLFSYLADPGGPIRRRAVVNDVSCTSSECHSEPEFPTQEFKFTEKVQYIHKTHEEETIEGQELHCSTCHTHHSAAKHFEVPESICYLCHFRETKFNEGRSKCALCHEIPTKSLQSQISEDEPDSEPITHQTLEDSKVPCGSCHWEVVSGSDAVKEENCWNCHDSPEDVEKADDKELMHEKHVTAQQADCFDCHQPIKHKEGEFLDPVRNNCQICHPDHHIFQKMLLVGAERGEVSATPGLMFDVKTNCLGCHIELQHHKGQAFLKGAAKACVACHTEEEENMLQDWKDDVGRELKNAKELEEEAHKAIMAAQGTVPEEKLNEAVAMLEEGRKNLDIVEYGNGVHNKKYSIMLLDVAMTRFEDLVDSLEEGTD